MIAVHNDAAGVAVPFVLRKRQSEPTSTSSLAPFAPFLWNDLGFYEVVGGAPSHPDTVDALLDLFDGNPTVAVWDDHWRPRHGLSRRTAFVAHDRGAALVGSYPFLGFEPTCECIAPVREAERRVCVARSHHSATLERVRSLRGAPSQQRRAAEAARNAAWTELQSAFAAQRSARATLRAGHTCVGAGCTYLCIDLDNKEADPVPDLETRAHLLVHVCEQVGLRPLAFTSRSGRGVHVFVFFDRRLPTAVANAAARALQHAAGIYDHADVIPSSAHPKFGTMHALPLSPLTRDVNGGLLLVKTRRRLRPVKEPATIVQMLREAHARRSSAAIVESFARQPHLVERLVGVSSATPPSSTAALAVRTDSSAPRAARPTRHPRPTDGAAVPTDRDRKLLTALERSTHREVRRRMRVDPAEFKGKRSAYDIKTARFLRRKGVSDAGIVWFLRQKAGSKTAAKGEVWAWTYVIDYMDRAPQSPGAETLSRRAGARLETDERVAPEGSELSTHLTTETPGGRSLSTHLTIVNGELAEGIRRRFESDRRRVPPVSYGTTPSPFWRHDVLKVLADARSPWDARVLAFLIDVWFVARGRRRFFMSCENLNTHLGIPVGTAGRTVRRLASRLPFLLAFTPGESDKTLGIANAFDVLGVDSQNPIDWSACADDSSSDAVLTTSATGTIDDGKPRPRWTGSVEWLRVASRFQTS